MQVARAAGFLRACLEHRTAPFREPSSSVSASTSLPLAPAVDLGPASPRTSPDILVDAEGEVTLGFLDETMRYRMRRFAADDTPLTPLLYADSTIGGGMFEPSGYLAAGEGGFLAAWTGSGEFGLPGIQVRAFGWDGAPLGPTREVAGAALGTATYFDSDLQSGLVPVGPARLRGPSGSPPTARR